MHKNTIELKCNCDQLDHSIYVHLKDTDTPRLHVWVQLRKTPMFLRRVVIGFRYVFGIKDKTHGHWDSTELGKSSARDLVNLLNEFIYLKDIDDLTE